MIILKGKEGGGGYLEVHTCGFSIKTILADQEVRNHWNYLVGNRDDTNKFETGLIFLNCIDEKIVTFLRWFLVI